MMHKIIKLLFQQCCVLLFILEPCASAQPSERELSYFQIPFTSQAPKIDGQMEEAWSNAVVLTGFSTLAREPAQADNQTKVRMMYDKNNLYIAFDSVLVGKKPRASRTGRDSAVYQDDSIELFISPPHLKSGQFYQMVANASGAVFDFFHGGSGVKWNANWTVANYVWDFQWVSEISVPLKDLGVENIVGKWRLNFCRSYEQMTAWSNPGSTRKGYLNYEKFAVAELIRKPCVVDVESMRGLSDGDISLTMNLQNRSDTVKKLHAAVYLGKSGIGRTKDASGGTLLLQGRSKRLLLRKPVKDKALNVLKLEITEGNNVVHRSINQFKLSQIESVTLAAVPDSNILAYEIDLTRIESPANYLNLKFVLVDANGTEAKKFESGPQSKFLRQICSQDIADIPSGTYCCSIEIIEPNSNKILETSKQTFTKHQMPEWYRVGKTLGTSKIVLPPWIPVKTSDNMVSVWGREYLLADSNAFGFKDIVSQGQSMLAAGLKLGAVHNASQLDLKLVSRSKLNCEATAARWTDLYSLGNIRIISDFTAEYDGMVKIEMKFDPCGKTQLDSLYLEIPLRNEFCRLTNYSCDYYGADYSGAVGNGIEIDFQNYVWLGSEKIGLEWFSEGPLNWNYQKKPIKINEHGIRIEFANNPTQIGKPFTIVFGLMATPVKAEFKDKYTLNRVPDELWLANLKDNGQAGINANLNVIWYDEGYSDSGKFIRNVDDGSFTTPLEKNTNVLRNSVMRSGNLLRHNVFYQYFSGTGPMALDFDKYALEWQRWPKREFDYSVGKHPEKHTLLQVCYNSSFSDYMLYGIKHLVDTTGIDGIYFDGSGGPAACDNHWHGCSRYSNKKGKIISMAPIFATRDFHKRLATMLYELKGDRSFLICHLSGTIGLPLLSFTHAYLDGESPGRASSMGGPRPTEITSLEYWRAHAVGGAAGIAPIFIIYTDRIKKDPAVYRGYLTMALVNGVPVYPLRDVLSDPVSLRTLTSVLRAQKYVELENAEFHGYWEQGNGISLMSADPNLAASFYVNRNHRKIMILLANRNKKQRETVLTLDKKTFGSMEGKRLFSVSDNSECVFDSNNQLTFKIGPEDFIAAVILDPNQKNELLCHPDDLKGQKLTEKLY